MPNNSIRAEKVWEPSEERKRATNLYQFSKYCIDNGWHNIDPNSDTFYPELHSWSVDDPNAFWTALWQHQGILGNFPGPALDSIQEQSIKSADWFPGTSLNFAENLLRYEGDQIALIERGEDGRNIRYSYKELRQMVAAFATFLRSKGVSKGDRVAAFLPNCHQAVVGMLAASSIGAIWSSCSPDFGLQGVLDRFSQIKPKVLIACNGYQYAGKEIDTIGRVDEIINRIEGLETLVLVSYLGQPEHKEFVKHDANSFSSIHWTQIISDLNDEEVLAFEPMNFRDPLYILYSSGTTGKPKCIVHSVGGTLVQHLKELSLHTDVGQASKLFYYTTCGWMMWNWLVSGLSLGATLVLYDGSPFHPQQTILFDIADEEGIEIFGASAKYYSACEKFGLKPRESHKLAALKSLLSTGSPLSSESFEYIYQNVKEDVCLSSISGGTDIVSCFALGNPMLPVYKGTLQCAGLGMDLAFYEEDGKELLIGKGELVCRTPFPSSPIGFWGDDGTKFHDAYFNRFEGVWAHGDYGEYLPIDNKSGQTTQSCVAIHGRSDAVLNPGGVRIGTAEIYRQVEKVDSVFESLAISQDWGDDVRIILFVRLKDEIKIDDVLVDKIKGVIRQNTTPRHVPAKVIQVSDLPRTLSGKIVELAVRKIIHGQQVTNKDALANPEALEQFKEMPQLNEI